ncbi:MAG: cell division protein ZapA [Magnetococcales bacterium]|nr:cell division protein ZapA [Magnetococcales bacterium]
MSESVEVKIHGQTFKLRTEAGKDYIRELAEYVDGVMGKMAQYSNSPASDRLAIMAALRIADTLFQVQREPQGRTATDERRLRDLISAADRLLEDG